LRIGCPNILAYAAAGDQLSNSGVIVDLDAIRQNNPEKGGTNTSYSVAKTKTIHGHYPLR